MTFVLVDYKGGAAFEDCVEPAAHRRHGHRPRRAPGRAGAGSRCGAELKRREHILAAAGAKDIEDYSDTIGRADRAAAARRCRGWSSSSTSSRRWSRSCPTSSPAWSSIAQRGRSLGIHLILATQRPSGVVSPDIRANTNLRIALRVTDAAESTDVIDAPDAARIAKSTPGRGVRPARARLAGPVPGRPGRRPAAGRGQPPLPSARGWPGWDRRGPAPRRSGRPGRTRGRRDHRPAPCWSDAIRTAAGRLRRPGASTARGCPPLPDAGCCSTTCRAGRRRARRTGRAAAAGPVRARRTCRPSRPSAPPCSTSTAFGHLMVGGAPRVRALAAAAHHRRRRSPRTLSCRRRAPVRHRLRQRRAAAADRPAALRRGRAARPRPSGRSGCSAGCADELSRRQELLGRAAASPTSPSSGPRRAGQAERLPHIVVLLDRWEGFTAVARRARRRPADRRDHPDPARGRQRRHAPGDDRRPVAAGRPDLRDDRGQAGVRGWPTATTSAWSGCDPARCPTSSRPAAASAPDQASRRRSRCSPPMPPGQGQAAALRQIAAEAAEPGRRRAAGRSGRSGSTCCRPGSVFDEAWELRDPPRPRPLWALVGVGGDELAAHGADLADGLPGLRRRRAGPIRAAARCC